MSNAINYLKGLINEEVNPMLIKNSLIKIEKAIQNIEGWTVDMSADVAERIKSNVSAAKKNIDLIKKQLQ